MNPRTRPRLHCCAFALFSADVGQDSKVEAPSSTDGPARRFRRSGAVRMGASSAPAVLGAPPRSCRMSVPCLCSLGRWRRSGVWQLQWARERHSAGKSSACPVFQGIELALPEASAAMARPSKAKVRSRMNGAKASNKGKVVSEPAHFVVMVDDSILEQKSSRGRGEPSGGVEFKVISRAKLHKNVLYGDEAWAKEQMARAAGVMRARYRPGCSPERPGLMSVATARAVLSAYAVATSDME